MGEDFPRTSAILNKYCRQGKKKWVFIIEGYLPKDKGQVKKKKSGRGNVYRGQSALNWRDAIFLL